MTVASTNSLVLIAGGSGDIGSRVIQRLRAAGLQTLTLTRTPAAGDPALISWDDPVLIHHVARARWIINLAGENVWSHRWTAARKQLLLQSRVDALNRLITLIKAADARPEAFINASGIAYYGTDAPREMTDESAPPGAGFLAELCQHCESILDQADLPETRIVHLRIGVTLSPSGVAFGRLLRLQRCLFTRHLGSGKQWLSWIHIDDVAALTAFMLTNPIAVGPYNLTAPHPLTFDELSAALALRVKRPRFLHIPSLLIRIAAGESAQVILNGSKVLPAKALSQGFIFTYPRICDALNQLLLSDQR